MNYKAIIFFLIALAGLVVTWNYKGSGWIIFLWRFVNLTLAIASIVISIKMLRRKQGFLLLNWFVMIAGIGVFIFALFIFCLMVLWCFGTFSNYNKYN
jgi:hypothetical protein